MGEHSVVSLRLFHKGYEEEFLWDSEMIKIKAADLKSKEVERRDKIEKDHEIKISRSKVDGGTFCGLFEAVP
uniref:THO complex subunit 2 isoform X2 n=1 Tax=Tanacetum cinerariifolium TaxID=118510 RepID=A0A6L2M036_TANCI|nr:THO complex subunit 2 isoform X2 [Tanacetum cinerariifolium]